MTRPSAEGGMGDQPVRVERVRVRDLPGFAERAAATAARNGGILPITPERALSQSRNPLASGDDVGLLVAWQGDVCVGYLGVLPGRLQLGAEQAPVHWLSTWLVAPELRGQQVGARLLSEACSLGHDLFGTMYTRSASRVLQAGGFREFTTLPYLELNFRRAAPWAEATRALRRAVRKRGRGWAEAAVRLDRAATYPAKRALYAWLSRRDRPLLERVEHERVTSITPDLLPTRPHGPDTVRFVRGPEVVEWTLRYPWVSEDAGARAGPGYHFSRARRIFRYAPLRFAGLDAAGFVLLSITDADERSTVKLLDHALQGDGARAAALALVLRHAAEHLADAVVLPVEFQPLVDADPLLRPLATRAERAYLGRPADPEGRVARALDRLEPAFPDSDVAFT